MKIITLKHARDNKLPRYFTGKPCKRGHVSERTTCDRKCLECKAEKFKRNYHADVEKSRLRGREKYYLNHDDNKKRARQYRINNLQKCLTRVRSHYINNKNAYKVRNAISRRRLKTATPKWLSKAQKIYISAFYFLCPEGHHVDHIVPIKGNNVCGLHVPWNLQILSAEDNLRKSNQLQEE